MIDDVAKTPGKCFVLSSDAMHSFLMPFLLLVVVFFIMLQDEHLSQILSNILQVKERGATTIVLTNIEDVSTVIDPVKIDFLIKLEP